VSVNNSGLVHARGLMVSQLGAFLIRFSAAVLRKRLWRILFDLAAMRPKRV